MRKTLILYIILLPTILSAQIGGNSTYRFLDLTTSARTSAIGGANVSLHDVGLIFNNPALMDSTTSNHLSVSYINYISDISWGCSSYTFKPSKLGNFAVGIQYINYGKFKQADEIGNITGSFTASDYVFNLAWAYPLDSFFTIGVTLKPIMSKYETYSSFGIASDVGITYFSRNKNFSAGLVLRNIGTQIKPYVTDNYEPLPFDIQLGVSQRLEHSPFVLSIVAHHLNKPNLGYELPETEEPQLFDQPKKENRFRNFLDLTMRHVIASVEIFPSKNFYLSLGFNYQRRQELKIAKKAGIIGFSGGLGIKIKRFSFNYGISKYHFAGTSHTLTMSLNLNKLFK